jgi:hypothetical protein
MRASLADDDAHVGTASTRIEAGLPLEVCEHREHPAMVLGARRQA